MSNSDWFFIPSANAIIAYSSGILFLTFFTLLAFFFKSRMTQHKFELAFQKLKTWWILIFILYFLGLAGPIGLIVLFAALSLFSGFELLACFGLSHRYMKLFCIVPILIKTLSLVFKGPSPSLLYLSFLFTFTFFLVTFNDRDSKFIFRGLLFFLSFTVIVEGFATIPSLVLETPNWSLKPSEKMISVIFLFILTSLSDAFQFFAGIFFPSAKVFPQLSPGKSLFGYVFGGGVAIGLGIFLSTYWFAFSLTQAAAVSFLVVISGMLGDLIFSTVKRFVGIKDFGTLLPGHGGILDRFDSLVAAAPLFLFLTQVFNP